MRQWLTHLLLIGICTSCFAKLKVGQLAPDIEGITPSGETVKLSDLRGKIVLIDFWASWCPHCRIANKDYVGYYERYHALGLEIFSVSVDDSLAAWKHAIAKDSLIWPHHTCDGKGLVFSKPAMDYDIMGTPTTFIIDESGHILAIDLPYEQLDKKLKWLFEDQAFFYPHQASDTVFFSHESKYKLENKNGDLVEKGKAQQLPVTSLADGTYSLTLNGKDTRELKVIHQEDVRIKHSFDKQNAQITLSRSATYEVHSEFGKLLFEGSGNKINLTDLAKSSVHTYKLVVNGKVSTFYWK